MLKQLCPFLGILAPAVALAQVPHVDELLNNTRVTLVGNVLPALRGRAPLGPVDPAQPMERMILALKLRPGARARLDQLLADQQDPASPLYHAWLQPEAFASAFGPDPADLAKVTAWLEDQGFTVDWVARSGLSVVFSGDVGRVQRAFRTPIQRFALGGGEHRANALDPSIPATLAGTVEGVVSLHDLPRRAAHTRPRPLFDAGSGHYLAPGDFATIYGLGSLHGTGTDGTGVIIGVLGRSNPGLGDVASFRSRFGLPAGHTAIVLNGPDPGQGSLDEALEADLDMEWAGATAPGASIQFVCSASTAASDGVALSALYAVDANQAAVLSLSFGACEAALGQAELAFYDTLWAQAAAQGVTVCVASGDSGAAGCEGGSDTQGSGQAVNGLASSPNATCVGGTLFTEGGGTFWAAANDGSGASALGYIPEAAWNESGAMPQGTGLWATGGGASTVYGKPYWQAGPGVPADGARDVPDLAFSAAAHDGYLVTFGGSLLSVGGTSASTPSCAGIMALLVQRTGQRQGNANPSLYALAAQGTSAFHDVLQGGNGVPGTPGFSAGAGYDQATGLGSVDAGLLLSARTGGFALAPAQFYSVQKLGEAFAQGFTPSGGAAPFTFAIAQGSLPPGLALAADGTLAGTLALEGTFAFVVTATEAGGRTAGAPGFLQVGPVTLTAGPAEVGQLVGLASPFTATVAGAVDTSAAWSASGGTVTARGPAGCTFTAPAAGAYTLTAAAAANPARTVQVTVQAHDADFMGSHAGNPLTGLDALYLAGAEGTQDPTVDLNGDGVVDAQDLAALLAAMGW